VTEERRLGEDLDVHERRTRLERDRAELFGPVNLARGVHVEDRNREHKASDQARQPAAGLYQRFRRSPAEDVVGVVDRFQQSLEMRRGGRLHGGAKINDRLRDGLERTFNQVVESRGRRIDRDDERLDRSPLVPQPLGARSENAGRRLGGGGRVGQKDQRHAGALERLAVEMRLERIEGFGRFGRRH
jgi:hypothetical protein